MSIRKPEPKAAVAMLRAAFQDAGADVQMKVAYDLLARLEGYKNWAHYQAENRNKPSAPSMLESPRLGRTEQEVADWPVWVFYTAWDDGEEAFFVMPFGTRLEDVLDSYGPDASMGAPDTEEPVSSDEERRESFVVRQVACWYPRADRYGFPAQANEREVAGWIDDELGWNYLANAQGDCLVEVIPTDTGDDSTGTYALEVSVSPARHELLLACFGQRAPRDGVFVERGREPVFRAGAIQVSLAELGDVDDELRQEPNPLKGMGL